jgi:membrane-associated protease RseP (regulator of RpoE activity)
MALGVPVELVRTISSEIREKGKVSRGWVGIGFSENEDGQVEVGEVEKDSPAELAKIEEGDIIASIDGRKVTGAPMVRSEIRGRKPGEDVRLGLIRDGKTVEVKVKLGEYPEAEVTRELEARFPRLFTPPPAQPGVPAPEAAPRPEKAPRALTERFRVWPGWEKRKYIGTYMETLNKELLDFFGVKEESGLLINRLTKDGPAEKAGLKVGDVVVRADGKKVTTVVALSELIQEKQKGDKVKLDIIRDKKPMSFEVEVAEEEGPSLSEFYSPGIYEKVWGNVGERVQREFGRSLKTYEKSGEAYRLRMKGLEKELQEKTQDSLTKARKLYQDSLGKERFRRLLTERNRIIYRA